MAFDYAARQARLATLIDDDVKAIAIVPGANMVYFTGLHFHLSERPTIALFDRAGGFSIIVPELETPKIDARPDLDGRMFVWKDEDGFAAAFEFAVASLKLNSGKLGLDGQTMRVFEWMAFRDAGIQHVANIGPDLLKIRARKTEEEVAAMREAIRISEGALNTLLDAIQPGMTEKQIAATLSRLLSEAGSEAESFAPAVQTGANSAFPHGTLTDRKLERDEILLIDFGGKKDEYPADITRCFCFGKPSDEVQRIYDTVLAANQAAIAAIKPGVTCGDIDRAARDVIEQAGYGKYFIHRTGHGLGLEVHELPQIAAGNDLVLEEGMVFTVEPGIYVPGVGGVRIEDNVHVTADGAEVLTSFPYTFVR